MLPGDVVISTSSKWWNPCTRWQHPMGHGHEQTLHRSVLDSQVTEAGRCRGMAPSAACPAGAREACNRLTDMQQSGAHDQAVGTHPHLSNHSIMLPMKKFIFFTGSYVNLAEYAQGCVTPVA